MNTQTNSQTAVNYRKHLLADLPVKEHHMNLAGISSAVLKGGQGPPLVLLHGPGETSIWWMRVIPKLVTTHTIIVPDLPGHGSSGLVGNSLDEARVFNWLKELIEQNCISAPTLVGHLLGGAISTRFALEYETLLDRLILVNSLGIGKFRPAPRFALELIRFLIRPGKRSYNRFLRQCLYSPGGLHKQMGKNWNLFVEYNLQCARDPGQKASLRKLMSGMGIPKIRHSDLRRINIPVALIWGRHDLANKLQIAKTASKRYGWNLHVIEKARDDPKLEQPEAFLEAFYAELEVHGTTDHRRV